MTAEGHDERRERPETFSDHGNSVIRFLEGKTGEAPRVNLREEDSASVSAPVIDPSSKEKLAVPQGRGNYQLMGEIARGGMGVVLKGHDTDLGRDIAVKVLDKRLCERLDVVQRFVEEAQIGGQLQHPGIVPVYELGMMADERPYFTMKLVKGKTLAALLAARETPSSNRGRLLDIFESICQTMAYAHSRGVIHRDLKPANIMVGAFGEVQVVDWGLAKVLVRGGTADERRSREVHETHTILETVRSDGSGSGTQSMVGSVLGTPAYMPPEQAAGRVDQLDERADVFALGAILCEILTGAPPYVGDAGEILMAASAGELDDALARLDACEADEVLVKATKQCLMPAAGARPADAGLLAERIHEYVISKEERAHRAEVEAAQAAGEAAAAAVRAEQERKAHRLTLALGAAVAAIVLVGGGGFLWVQNERAAQREAESERLRLAAVRDQELSSEVNAALNTAATLQGAERWNEAVVAAERARALAQGGGASEELLASIDSALFDLNAAIDETREREELRLDSKRLLAALREAAQPSAMGGDAEKAQAFRTAFLAHGLDLDAGELQSVAASVTQRKIGSEVALALDDWAEIQRLEGNEDGALRLLELAHLVDPDPERAHLREAVASRDLDELRFLAGSGLERQPASTIVLLATSLDRLEDRETALSVLRSGVERHPEEFELLFSLGRLLSPPGLEAGVPEEHREAGQCYRAALALDPDNPSVRFRLGRVFEKLDDLERARDQFQKAVDAAPAQASFRYRLAEVQAKLELHEEARANFERTAEREEPQWMRGWSLSWLSNIAFQKKQYDEAVELGLEAWNSKSTPGWANRVLMLMQLFWVTGATGDPEPTLMARDLLDERFRFNSTAYNFVAWELVTKSQGIGERTAPPELSPEGERFLLEAAVELAQHAMELDPQEAAFWNTRGVARYFLGDFEGAVEDLLKDMELYQGDSSETWFPLAMAYHELGNEELARKWYDHGVHWMVANETTEADQWFRMEAARLLGEE